MSLLGRTGLVSGAEDASWGCEDPSIGIIQTFREGPFEQGIFWAKACDNLAGVAIRLDDGASAAAAAATAAPPGARLWMWLRSTLGETTRMRAYVGPLPSDPSSVTQADFYHMYQRGVPIIEGDGGGGDGDVDGTSVSASAVSARSGQADIPRWRHMHAAVPTEAAQAATFPGVAILVLQATQIGVGDIELRAA